MIAPFEAEVALLITIPGIERRSAQELIAEIGVDMTRFPSAAHLASWAGTCPGHHESAGKRRSGQTRPGSEWLHRTLNEAAKAAARTKITYLGARSLRLRGRRGPAKTTTAVGHSILVAAFHLLRDGVTYNEPRPDWFDRLSPDQHARRLARQIEALGFTVTIERAA